MKIFEVYSAFITSENLPTQCAFNAYATFAILWLSYGPRHTFSTESFLTFYQMLSSSSYKTLLPIMRTKILAVCMILSENICFSLCICSFWNVSTVRYSHCNSQFYGFNHDSCSFTTLQVISWDISLSFSLWYISCEHMIHLWLWLWLHQINW